MLLIAVLIFIKTLLFIVFTEIQFNISLVFFVTITMTLLVLSLINKLKMKRKRLYIGLYYTIVSLVLFADVLYYSHFNTLPSVAILGEMKLLPKVSSSVGSLIGLKELLFIIDLPLVYYVLYKKIARVGNILPRKFEKLIPITLTMALMLCYSYTDIKGLDNSLKYQEPYSYHFNDILKQIRFLTPAYAKSYKLDKEHINELRNRAKLKEGKLTGIAKDKNLIVIQVEALQNFVINLEYNGQEITPNLNKFLKENGSIYFDNYYQQIGRGNTSDAEFVSNHSMYPATDAPSYAQYDQNTHYGLPKLLKDYGYNTMAFHGFEKDFWNRNKAYKAIGFDRFYSRDSFSYSKEIGLGIRDEDFFKQTVDRLKNYKFINDQPFYAFLVTLSSHDPFDLPDEYKKIKILDEDKDTKFANYINSIHYFDYSLGIFIEELKKNNLYDNSVIALYGDHFAIQDSEKDSPTMERLLGKKYGPKDIMNIPFIIHIPNNNKAVVNNKLGSQLDFFPTIQNILGVDNKKGIIYGRDLNNYEATNYVVPQSIMNAGSFISDDVIFTIPKTRIFEEATVIDINTRKSLNLNNFKDKFIELQSEVEECEFILKNDLLKEIIQNK